MMILRCLNLEQIDTGGLQTILGESEHAERKIQVPAMKHQMADTDGIWLAGKRMGD
jgi:hypothetical protein